MLNKRRLRQTPFPYFVEDVAEVERLESTDCVASAFGGTSSGLQEIAARRFYESCFLKCLAQASATPLSGFSSPGMIAQLCLSI